MRFTDFIAGQKTKIHSKPGDGITEFIHLLFKQQCFPTRESRHCKMRFTIFNTPVIRPLFTLIARLGLFLSGWKVEGKKPKAPRFILVAAPHTSNLDFFYGIAIGLCTGVHCYWMGKSSLFWGPFGPIMRWLGGIAVDRTKPKSMVKQTVCAFKGNKQLRLVICPEGTRAKGDRWRTGFYHVAKNANIPIVLGYLDFKRKVGGFGPIVKPTNNMEKDLCEIQAFYESVTGKHPERFSPVQSKGCCAQYCDTLPKAAIAK